MADFDSAVASVFYWEGFELNDPSDKGGLTKYGISQAAHPEVDVSTLTMEQAKEIYQSEYWVPSRAGDLQDQKVATKYFNLCVNMGIRPACRLLQLACIDSGRPTLADGAPGNETVHCANACNQFDLLVNLKARATSYYYKLVAYEPGQAKFLKGWLNRVNA